MALMIMIIVLINENRNFVQNIKKKNLIDYRHHTELCHLLFTVHDNTNKFKLTSKMYLKE